MTPAAYLEKTGIFNVPAVAAHCVYSDDSDLEIFKRKGVTVAANPVLIRGTFLEGLTLAIRN